MSFLKGLFKTRMSGAVYGQLERYGVFAYNNQNLDSRTNGLVECVAGMKDLPVKEQIEVLDRAVVDVIAAAWGRGGDVQRYFRAYGSWKKLVNLFHSMARNGDGSVNDEEMCTIFAFKQVIPYGWMIVNAAWRDKDISPQTPIVVQTPGQIPSYGKTSLDEPRKTFEKKEQDWGDPKYLENKAEGEGDGATS